MAVLRGSDPRDTIDVEFQAGDAFTPALRTRMVSPVPGYTQSVLNVYHYTVNRSGKVEKCDYEEQRGTNILRMIIAWNLTRRRSTRHFPPLTRMALPRVGMSLAIL
jgi:hypothetical protein